MTATVLPIETFSNATGGNVFYKAIGHPLAAEAAAGLVAELAANGPVAIFDTEGQAAGVAALLGLDAVEIAGFFVQRVEHLDRALLGRPARPVTELPASRARRVLVTAFDAARAVRAIRHLLPSGAEIRTLDAIRLPDSLLGNPARYLDPLNFATNFAFFRDADGLHTRLVTANYWAGYGASGVFLWLRLFDGDGRTLATWHQPVPDGGAAILVDSRDIRRRFGLGPFTGQLFIHAVGARGHDVLKYALDVDGEHAGALSCTHDANAWPSDRYAGLPAPAPGERVILWIQNSHAAPIPAGSIGLAAMGCARVARLDRTIPGFATLAVDTAALLPDLRWPQQFELHAGKHVVRPRYEIVKAVGPRRIGHLNVMRDDLRPDPRLADLGRLMGKGHILPAPLLPPGRWRTELLPTPMATRQAELPLALLVYDAGGRLVTRRRLGRLRREACPAVDLDAILADAPLPTEWGHVELVYDFAEGGEADGWLHAIFRYTDRESGHAAETSFGAHMFNTALTYRGEPQSYAGPPPGLSTRLFLRLGPEPLDTLCHLIYPASTPWHARSATDLVLHDGAGAVLARRRVEIPCSGSLLWRAAETFSADERRRAGPGAYVIVRDLTCRLFGYHGLLDRSGGFSLDHMFGF